MPRRKPGLQKNKKHGTNNKKQAKKRDRLAAQARRAAEKRERAAGFAAATPTVPENTTPVTAVVNRKSSEQLARRREAIVYWYVELGEPPKRMWHGRGGTLSQIAEKIELEEDKYGKKENVLQHFLDAEPLAYHGGGGRQKLTHGEALVVAEYIERRRVRIAVRRARVAKPPRCCEQAYRDKEQLY